jgi:rhodanese-related sulfurtransferase
MDTELKVVDPKKAKAFFENKLSFTAGPMEIKYLMDEGEAPHIIDVRRREDYEEGHVPGAINLPEEKWSDLSVLKKDQTNVIYCYSIVCHLAARAAFRFASEGFPVLEMDGGMKSWEEHELPVEQGLHQEKRVKNNSTLGASVQ